MSLSRPLADWPLLICGPILRRVTPTSVNVFLVTSSPCTVEVVLSSDGAVVATGPATPTRMVGALLNVTVASVTPPAALTPDVVYTYDIRMTPTLPAGPTVTLASQPGLLSGPVPLGYTAGALPSFSLPNGLQYLNVVHTSCRKPHGGGPDATALVDRLINAAHGNSFITGTAEDARRRPQQLLLTGDQIYADDVAVSLLPVLMEVGGLLLGETTKERFPPGTVMTAAEVKPGPSRLAFLHEHTQLSSDHMENHLMYLAEFCAMYVMAWSDELWARDAAGRPVLDALDELQVYPESGKSRAQARADRTEVLSYAKTVRRVRRALANVPTMMMFDDHEVSDDWNLDSAWVSSARNDPGTHRVVRNALVAQTVFQAWGNRPDLFATGLGKDLLDLVTIAPGSLRTPLAVTPAAADTLLDIGPGPSAPGARVNWDWHLDGPEHRVIALDSRTHRDYAVSGRNRPGLLTATELDRQLTSRRPADPTVLVLVIAPAPVMGHPIVEEGAQPMLASSEGDRAADFETWASNRPGYEALLRRLAAFRRVVLLSGDVHYGFTNHTAYFGANQQPPARIVQLCSSSAKNSDTATRAVQAIGYLNVGKRGWFGFSTPISDDDGAALRTAMRMGAEASPTDKALRGLYFDLIVTDRLSTPPVIPAGPWISDQAANLVGGLVALGRPDDWCYQVNMLVDGRTPARRLVDAGVTAGALPPAVQHLVETLGTSVVGEANIGQIRLQMIQGRLDVIHRLHWLPPGIEPENAPTAWTEHVAPLTVPGATEKPQVFR
ncbi:hypothetical protein [Cellulomonas sp. URHD0024]|uniref:hypothetical protein n=1 Tax=Cellulomonas sp. URHD0024 TaxID=1302620 RepID=UPI000417B2D5|nr:hypothetical protein [Cellulomonas sp. URHD0024]